MSLPTLRKILRLTELAPWRAVLLPCHYYSRQAYTLIRSYAAAAKEGKVEKKGVKGETKEVKEVVLNMDVCLGANYFKTGEDPVIKAESDYPEWLWGLLDSGRELESKQHWRRLQKAKAHKAIASSMEKR